MSAEWKITFESWKDMNSIKPPFRETKEKCGQTCFWCYYLLFLFGNFFDRKSPCDLLFLSNLSIIIILFDICQFLFYIVLWQIVIFATLVLMWKRVISCVCVHFHLDGEANLEQVGDVMAVAGLLKLFLVRRE